MQRFKEGSFVKIEFSKDRIAFGRLIYKYSILAYDYTINVGDIMPQISDIESLDRLFYVGIDKSVITAGDFEIIGFKKLEHSDTQNIPPKFWQDIVDISKCAIYFHDGSERSASPTECIGLEQGAAWSANSIRRRLEDHYDGRKNFTVELFKPILSEKDIRYMPQPKLLKWNFEKEEFYKEDP